MFCLSFRELKTGFKQVFVNYINEYLCSGFLSVRAVVSYSKRRMHSTLVLVRFPSAAKRRGVVPLRVTLPVET